MELNNYVPTKSHYKIKHLFRRLHNLKKKHERVKTYYLNPKTCPFCTAPLSYERKHKTFCSRSCAMAMIKTGRPRLWVFTCCNYCHKDLWGPHRLQVKYCSQKCYQADKWRKIVEEIKLVGKANDARTAKKYLLQVKPHKCEDCGRRKFKGENIALQIHHINANPEDHRLKNLQLLCSLCHSATESYCGKKHRLTRGNHK